MEPQEEILKYSETDPTLMDKQKIFGFYLEEFALMVGIIGIMGFTIGGLLEDTLELPISKMKLIMVGLAIDILLGNFLLKNRETAPPNFLVHVAFTRLGKIAPEWAKSFAGKTKRMEHYYSVEWINKYSD